MVDDPGFEARWESVPPVNLQPAERVPTCLYAKQFDAWCVATLARLAEAPSLYAIQQKKLLLVERFFDWRAVVPRAHRNCMSEYCRHRCIWSIFEENYLLLKAAELSLTGGPLLMLPSEVGVAGTQVKRALGIAVAEE